MAEKDKEKKEIDLITFFQQLLTQSGAEEISLENFQLAAEELELKIPIFQQQIIQQIAPQIAQQITQTIPEAKEIPLEEEIKKIVVEEFKFEPLIEKITQKAKLNIAEVQLGGTRSEGGTRDFSIKIGGESAMPFYFSDGKFPNKPVISHDVFDMKIPLPKFVRDFFVDEENKDVMNDPGEWAKLRVRKYGAKMVTIHLVSTDPTVKDVPINEAMKSVEKVLQAVKVPIVIGGSGNPEKDPKLLAKAAEVAAGEKVLLNSIDENMDWKTVVQAVKKYDQRVILMSSMNPDVMKRLAKNVLDEGVRPDQIVMDMVTGAVGYGIEYSISAMERVRLAGLAGDKDLAFPIACAGSNAWGAREAFLKNDLWGPRELRGPLWETLTTTIALLSGTDIFLMLHPVAIASLQNLIDKIYDGEKKDYDYMNWITKKIPT